MGATAGYVAILLVGVVLVVVDGQVIYRSGRAYLEGVYSSPEAAAGVNRLTVTLFHLVVLGLLALLSTLDTSPNSIGRIIGTLGIFLLVLAAAHATTIGIYNWLRGRQHDLQVSDRIARSHTGDQVYREANQRLTLDTPEQQPHLAPPLDPPGPPAY